MQVLSGAEAPQIDECIRHQFHGVVPTLQVLKPQQQPLKLAVHPQHLFLLSNDAELALVEGDSDRLHRRVDVALPQVTPKDQLFAILPFLTWLANPAQGWAHVITAINTLEPGVEFAWNFSDTRPATTRLDVTTQQAAQHFIDFFEGRIDLPTLQARLAAK